MGLTAAFIIQPSGDAKATAISIAWMLASNAPKSGGDDETAVKKHADLIGEIAGRILSGAQMGYDPLTAKK